MSHNCPECGALCYCGGDIDDCCLDLPEDQAKCTHYKECDPDDDETDHHDEEGSWEENNEQLG